MLFVDNMTLPADVGRIPRKIETGLRLINFKIGLLSILFLLFLMYCQRNILSAGDILCQPVDFCVRTICDPLN